MDLVPHSRLHAWGNGESMKGKQGSGNIKDLHFTKSSLVGGLEMD